MFVYSASRQETWEASELFKSQPTSDLDALGKKRYVGKSTLFLLHDESENFNRKILQT